MKVLESKETPGLGDKIDKDPRFKSNFDALEVALAGDGSAIAHPVVLVKYGQKTETWQIEAITGATISSRAVTQIIEKSTAEAVPVILGNLPALEHGAK
jgi:electron transport complex protein RnfG